MTRYGAFRWLLVAPVVILLLACAGATAPLSDVGNRLSGPANGPTAGPVDNGTGPGGQDNQAPEVPDQQLIVYSGSMELEVADLDAAVTQADQLVRSLGGHVAASQTYDRGDGKTAAVTYRIPAARWSEALAGLHALATRVVTETTGSEDVTTQVVDLDARLANLRVTETAMQLIMDRATTITDVLKVQQELTTIRGDIERLTAQRDYLANRAALATLEVGFGVPVGEASRASEGWDLGREVDSALAALVRLGQWAASLLIWTVLVLVPLFVPIILVIYLALRIRRRWVATHPQAPVGGPPPWTPSM